ncbi:(deoxy)nucleoside triphosphate pyrophosphohydrolase [Sporosarcina luteola]|uniref:(deoxy)nucleoside triphosphate pyrophosphohydrolase n=1 Tax=Sporosarcina luteola TaxID=582850 RepID=UPI00203EF684|nr:(deoxy)nucleoside triphosphate pyrophosphohydrolase [Sporosarcina luteola]MCM3710551.1 (deoxy)nucleoside triphosphate pyrophosphohydrolase [Sporosarcina luteola]
MTKIIHVVGAVIHNEKGEILCARRSKNMSLPGYWEFPGGKIEPGETPQIALFREIKEELHCDIAVGQFVEDTIYAYNSDTVRLATYFAEIIDGTPIAYEHSELKWVPFKELYSIQWAPADIPAVERVIRLCKKEFMSN